MVPRLSFVVVGTPRSGTTLVQRLCCQLPGVAMPPETHFLQLHAPRLLSGVQFPLSAGQVREEVRAFASLPTSRTLRVDADRVVDLLGGSCPNVLELFRALVVALADADAPADRRCYGEKTPEHLLWWRVLTRADPQLKVIGVVRDPRDVAASHREVPWGIDDAAELAEEWALDQGRLLAARRALGERRCLLLSYESVVEDPAVARCRIAAFLGVDAPLDRAAEHDAEARSPAIVQAWEWWKSAALAPVTIARVARWRSVLTPLDVARIEASAQHRMRAFGYAPSGASAGPVPGPADHVRPRLAARVRRIREWEERCFAATRPAPPPG